MLDGGHCCRCMIDALKLQNMEKVWPSLSQAKEVPHLRQDPKLRHLLKRDLWITAKENVFRAHLKAVAFSQSTMWDAKVISDLDLIETWLKTAKAQGHKIYDSEIDNHAGKFVAMDIAELVEPFGLVILKLGVKQAPNKEMHSVLLEALATRRHLGRPTWIVDQPDQRIDDMAHRGYSEILEMMLSHWIHVALIGSDLRTMSGPEPVREPEIVSDMDANDILENSNAAVDDALSDLKEDSEEVEGEDEDDTEAVEVDEEWEDDEGDGEEEEPEDEGMDPAFAAMMANEDKPTKKKKYKKPFKKGGKY